MAFASVIKYEGNNKTFVWKYPEEDFNTSSQLIVHESQEAIFFKDGKALDLFGAGRYTLETQNIPIIGRLLNIATGGETPFHCEVYFINKTEQLNIKWGTDTKVQYIEPTYNFPISVGACGEMSLVVNDSRKLLTKIVGTQNELTQEQVVMMFKGFLMTKIKPYIAKQMRENKINIFEIDEHLQEFSNDLKQMLVVDFDDYGVELSKFIVTTFMKPEDDPMFRKFKDLYFRNYADVAEAKLNQQVELIKAETSAQKVVIDSKAQATKRAQEGYTYQQERGFDVARDLAKNDAKGQFTNLGIGLGTMAGVGVGMSHIVNDALNNANSNNISQNNATTCKKCGSAIPANSKFCLNCGEKISYKFNCPQCGKELVDGAKFCPECGAKII